jgi:chemotaxis protein histidine kinase CheA
MLSLRSTIRTTVLAGLAVLLIAGTAAGKNERAAERQAARQARRDERQSQAADRRAERQAAAAQRQAANQARVEANRQAAAQRQAERQAANQARVEANRQAAAQRQAATTQRRAENQARTEVNRQAAAERREANQAQRQENRQVRVERQEANQAQRQENRQVRVERREERQEQTAQNRQAAAERRAEILTARNENKRSVTRNVERDINIERIVGPRGTKVTRERNVQVTRTVNGRSFSRDVSRRVVRNYPNGRTVSINRRFPGRRPGRIFSHIVWPSYGYPVYYRHGSDIFFHYVRPSYHRKYVFVSFGTYWPAYYSSLRYYWYGWHPYTWYGCYPTAYGVEGDTYNYYTYNTYNYESDTPQSYSETEYGGPLESVDETTFEDIRQKLTEQSEQQPEAETLVDKFFEDGVVAFEQGDYDTAAKAFADAIVLEPNDLVLPFAYVQALFASEQYSKAADILRLALVQMPAEEQGLFFPRGLYSEDEILFGQIDKLQNKAETFAYDPDMPLLLGYQLIGVERYEQAREQLERAGRYDLNKEAATILLNLLDKLEGQTQVSLENI